MKIFKKILIVVGAVIAVYMLFLTVEYIRFYNKGYGVKPIFVINEIHKKAEDGYGSVDKYIGLGYTVTYEHSYEEIYEEGEMKGYRCNGLDSDIRLFGIKVKIKWYLAHEQDVILFKEK